MAQNELDVALYGASRVPDVNAVPVQSTDPATAGYVPPTPVLAQPRVGATAPAVEGAAVAGAVENRVEASALESLGASFIATSVGRAVELLDKPRFKDSPDWDAVEFTNSVPYQLQEPEREKLLQSKSKEEALWWQGRLKDERMLQAAMGDNPVTSLLPQLVDPAYLAVDAASLGIARVARVSRAGAALASAAGSAAIDVGIASQVAPVSTEEIVLNALFNGAGTAMAYRGGKLQPADPHFPGDSLAASARAQADIRTGGVEEFHPSPAAEAISNVFTPGLLGGLDMAPKLRYAKGTPGVVLDEVGNAVQTTERVLAVDSVADIGQFARNVQAGRVQIDPSAKAVFLPDEDKVFIIKDNLTPQDDLKGIILHEVGVHMNLERALGTEQFLKLLDDFEAEAARGNGAARKAYAQVPKDTPNHLVREEALGYYIEKNHGKFSDNFVSRAYAAIKQYLRKLGVSLKYTEADFTYLVRKAASKRNLSADTAFPYVWHGSPIKGIDQLDLAYAGSGEGRSAFGFGHYVTSEKGTALDYRNKESIRRGQAPEQGGLYRLKVKVGVDEMLNWAGAEQSPKVQAVLDKLGLKGTGEEVYRGLELELGSERAASEFLDANGIKGVQYATGRTRYTGGQNSNYVLFSNDALDMAVRYSKPAAPETLGEAASVVASDPKLAQKLGKGLAWNWHKSMAKLNSKAADLLLQDPLDLKKTSAAGEKDVARREWSRLQYQFEDKFLDVLKARGIDYTGRIFQWGKGRQAYIKLERDVLDELARRADAHRNGTAFKGSDPAVVELADLHAAVTDRVLSDAKGAKVTGAEGVQEGPGYFSRRWDFTKIEDILSKFKDPQQGYIEIIDVLERSIKRANPTWAGQELPVKQGFVRMYHGGISGGGPRKAWLTPDRAYAEGYAAKTQGAVVQFIDLPETSPLLVKAFDDTGTSIKAPFVAFEADEALAAKLSKFEDNASIVGSVAKALYERARSKSYFEDAGYSGHMGLESVIEVRRMLDNLGIPMKDRERVLEFMVGQVDEAGKPTSFKHRIALDASEELRLPDGSTVNYLDMIDTGALTLLDRYADNMGGRVGLARVGLAEASEIDKLKLDGMQGIKVQADREQFNILFDDAVKSLLGFPVGEASNKFLRGSAAVTQMVGLSWSGLYQITELAVPMAKYGLGKTFRYALGQMPGFKGFLGDLRADSTLSSSLVNVLTDFASQDVRMRPVLQRFEDNFEMPVGDAVLTTLQQGRQLVPYINGMKWVHHWTAKTTANLITDTLLRAAKGDVKAAETLSKYGLTGHTTVNADILKHGMDTAKWSDETWQTVRGPVMKMMDEAVLRSRLGELPHFVQTSALGKFLFTFRSFILAAHNKLLAGTLTQEGFAGLGLILMHQLPLAMLTAHAQAAIQNKDLDEAALAAKAISQMGAWGLFSEAWGIVSGQRNEVGVPGMIGPDRIVGAVSAGFEGNLDVQKVLAASPLLGASPVIKALQHLQE